MYVSEKFWKLLAELNTAQNEGPAIAATACGTGMHVAGTGMRGAAAAMHAPSLPLRSFGKVQ